MNFPSLRYAEECCNEARLASLMDASRAGEVDASNLLLRLIHYDRSLTTPFQISSFGFWTKDHCFEVQGHISRRLPVNAGRPTVELYAIPPD